jgi:TRAP-type C4-dicarboxylate transport system permease small subunit
MSWPTTSESRTQQNASNSGGCRIDHALLETIRVATAVILAIMFVVIILEVAFRYVLGSPSFWTGEFARYAMFYMVLIGSAAAIRQKQHPSLTFVIQRFRPALRRIWTLAIDGLVFLVMVVIFWQGCVIAIEERIGQTASLRISFFWVYIALPTGALLMMIQLVAKYVFGPRTANPDEREAPSSEGG